MINLPTKANDYFVLNKGSFSNCRASGAHCVEVSMLVFAGPTNLKSSSFLLFSSFFFLLSSFFFFLLITKKNAQHFLQLF